MKFLSAPHLPAYVADFTLDEYTVVVVKDHGPEKRGSVYSEPSSTEVKKSGTMRGKNSEKGGKYYTPEWMFWTST